MASFRFIAFIGLALLGGCKNPKSGSAPDQPQVLRVADQLQVLEPLLAAAGENKPVNYTIQWSNFLTGPAEIAAITGGSVDVGWMAETPLIFAQAAGSPVKVVAASQRAIPGTAVTAVVVKPGAAIHSIADLKGRRIGWMPGTVTQYLVIRLLEKQGLSAADIVPVVMTSGGPGMLNSGTVDALVTADPYLSEMLAAGQVRILATGGASITPELQYVVAGSAPLVDPQRSAMIGDFVRRVARSFRWQREHPAEAAATASRTYKVTLAVANQIVHRAPSRYVPIDGAIVAAHQKEADVFQRLGLIRERVDAAKLFDHRYDQVVAKVEGGR